VLTRGWGMRQQSRYVGKRGGSADPRNIGSCRLGGRLEGGTLAPRCRLACWSPGPPFGICRIAPIICSLAPRWRSDLLFLMVVGVRVFTIHSGALNAERRSPKSARRASISVIVLRFHRVALPSVAMTGVWVRYGRRSPIESGTFFRRPSVVGRRRDSLGTKAKGRERRGRTAIGCHASGAAGQCPRVVRSGRPWGGQCRSMFVFTVVSPFRLRVSHHLDRAAFPIPATRFRSSSRRRAMLMVLIAALCGGRLADGRSARADSPSHPYCAAL
jgi:hypothetical protein